MDFKFILLNKEGFNRKNIDTADFKNIEKIKSLYIVPECVKKYHYISDNDIEEFIEIPEDKVLIIGFYK